MTDEYYNNKVTAHLRSHPIATMECIIECGISQLYG